MKVVLSTFNDMKTINCILAKNNVQILKSKTKYGTKRYITINIPDYATLNRILNELNQKCFYSVNIHKVKRISNIFNFWNDLSDTFKYLFISEIAIVFLIIFAMLH